jgi:hypothetical protein
MSNKEQASVSNKLHKLMYELLYPAILGSALYSVVNHFALHLKHYDDDIYIRLSLGGLFTAFFCASALTTYDKENYGKLSFVMDLIEVFLMYLCFYFLGFFPQDEPPYSKPEFISAHLTIIALLFTQLIWRHSVNLEAFEFFELRLILCVLLIISMVLGYEVTPVLSILAFLCIYVYVNRPECYMKYRSIFLKIL